ncbi:hypothetical protein HX89_12495 [Dermacoccus nishinomiyaensis]|uniref:Uncharacterized protein n=1 Tax=Dermacoccus nishinomiyaensis TaxID=1274 RepID=A0A075JJX0_9MICO|nr:hypothetical protein HX89_12495 [Dermacoccus nishinomiyaensis]
MLGMLAKHVEQDPANVNGPRRFPDQMVSPPTPSTARRDRSQTRAKTSSTDADVSASVRSNDSSGPGCRPSSARLRPVRASSNQTRSTNVACFTRPSSVVVDGTSRRRASASLNPSRDAAIMARCWSMNTPICCSNEAS